AVTVQQHPHHHRRGVGRHSSSILTSVDRHDLGQVQFVGYLGDEARQMILRQPVLQRRREKEYLVQIAGAEALAHTTSVPDSGTFAHGNVPVCPRPNRQAESISDRLLGIRFFARRDDFHVGRPEPWRSLSGCRVPTHRDAPSLFAACRYAGQVGNPPPTTRPSTPFECNHSTNSRQSLFSGIRVTAVAEFDKDLQPLIGRHRRVLARVGLIGVFEVGKYPRRFLHACNIARRVRQPVASPDPPPHTSSHLTLTPSSRTPPRPLIN